MKSKKKYPFILIFLLVIVLCIIGVSQFIKIDTNYYCCESPTVRWKFALYCGECDDETGCHYTRLNGTGLLEYLGLREVNCSLESNPNSEMEDSTIQNDAIEKYFYSSGELQVEIEYDETGIGYTHKEFYKNGQLKSLSEQGEMDGCGIQVGEELNYNEGGLLIQKKTFLNLSYSSGNCHDIKIIIKVVDYNINGTILKTSSLKSCYECNQCPCGVDSIYNTQGDLIETIKHSDCDDFKMECDNN